MSPPRPCECDRFVPGRSFASGRDCPLCWMFAHRPEVREAWGGAANDAIAIRESPAAAKFPRVLFATHDLSLSGAPILLFNFIRHLRGFSPIVYSPVPGPLQARYEEAGFAVTSELDLAVSLVVANTLASAPVVAAARAAGVPCVWLIHESDPDLCGNADAVVDLIDWPKRIVFASQTTAAAYAHLRTRDVEVIPTVIPPPPLRDRESCRRALGLEPHEFAIVTMGADEPRKGQADIREAIRGMDGIRYLPVAGDPDPWRYFAAADLYICSSRVESFPLSIQEAKAFGVPVVTTNVFGCAEQIHHGVHGLHYEPGDVEGLRKAIEDVRAHPGRYARPLDHLPHFDETVERLEGVLRDALGQSDDPQPLHVVYHVAGMGPWWKPIVTEQLEQLRAAGLTRVLATHVGEEPEWLLDEAARHGVDLILCEHDPDVSRYETPAILLVERLARHADRPILYFHSKGISHPPEESCWHEWRRLMMAELVTKWREQFAALNEGFDAVGVNWWYEPGNQHFSGNFWMASPRWLRGLPKFGPYFHDRYSCEVWIGSVPGCRVKSLLCNDLRFWERDLEALYELRRKSLIEADGDSRACTQHLSPLL